MIRTIIVDDKILSRIGIQSLIDGKEEVTVCGTFGSAEEALKFLEDVFVDIVITDIEMLDMNGLEFIEVIREKNLAEGIIILSCHEKFSYAQEAISKGTDSYLLKHNVTEESLMQEIKKAYQKNQTRNRKHTAAVADLKKEGELLENGSYVLAVLRAGTGESGTEELEMHLESTMLAHLLEEIVDRHGMGTLFSPYNKEMFIVFQMDAAQNQEETMRRIDENISVILKNMQQYINTELTFGISSEFGKLAEMRTKYQEALDAVSMHFYEKDVRVFWYTEISEEMEPVSFCPDELLEEGGLAKFETQLSLALTKGRFERVKADVLKEQLMQSLNMFIHQVLAGYSFREDFSRKWNGATTLVSAITAAQNAEMLKASILKVVGCFRTELIEEWEKDDLAETFRYIEKNLPNRITLADLTEISCMSVPSFSKKFKERTGQSLVQYLNDKRIDRACSLLKNKNYSLEQVAELTGFSNANYLIRVFKKRTGKTVGEYRKRYGIDEME